MSSEERNKQSGERHVLFEPFALGPVTLSSRIVMAPMTRSRADNPGRVASPMTGTYYEQRASAGLIISEGTQVSKRAVGYLNTPGIHSAEQVTGWKQVTARVHAQQGKIFAQLWHVGRISHVSLLGGLAPLAPSAINAEGRSYTEQGFVPTSTPEAMTLEQIEETQEDFVRGAQNALEAGFDGVEIHAANGYLFHQFFSRCSNVREDRYGGSRENRARFLFETLDRMQRAGVPLERVGVRLNPSAHGFNGMTIDEETMPTFEHIITRLNDYPIAFLHLCEPFNDVSKVPFAETQVARRFRPMYRGVLMTNSGFDRGKAERFIDEGLAELVAFGKPFISNPDLVARLEQGAELAPWDTKTFYTTGPRGYIDYPKMPR